MIEINFSKNNSPISKLDFYDFVYKHHATIDEVLIKSKNPDTGTEYRVWHSYNDLKTKNGRGNGYIIYRCSGVRLKFKNKSDEVLAKLSL